MARVLVVDDDEQVRRVLKITLQRAGYDVTEAENGDVALRLYRSQPADVVVMDIVMPNKEGIETIQELRAEFPSARLIAISGGGRISPDDYLALAKRFGASRTFAKPIDRQALLCAVAELVDEAAVTAH